MTQQEAATVSIDDRVLVNVSQEGWVPGTLVVVMYPETYGKRKGYKFEISADDGREFPDVPPRFLRKLLKQDWRPGQKEY